MKKIIIAILVLTTLASCKESAKKTDNSFTLTITGGEHFPENALVAVWRAKPSEEPQRVEYIKTEKFSDGTFIFKGTVDDVHIVAFDIVPKIDSYPYARVTFPLEPGAINVDFTARKKYNFKGGKYGALLVNSWMDNADYKKATKDFQDYNASLNGKTIYDIKDKAKQREYGEIASQPKRLKLELMRKAINDNKEDPLVELLAYDAGYSGEQNVDVYAVIEGLANKVGLKHRQSKVSMIMVNRARASMTAKKTVGVGAIIKDFEAKNLQGETFHLADVLKENKYVLVEFWASWCGPCRAEIPHMKKAYSHFKDKGFEIVSFTLDNKKEAWKKASKEEQIPWIDTGDLLSLTSPVVKMYGVTAVPANYLVEAATGKIIAKDLRQQKLDNKLAELLK